MGCPNDVWWLCSPSCILKFPTPAAWNLNFPASCSHKISASIIIYMEKLNRLIANPFFLSPNQIAEGNNLTREEHYRNPRLCREQDPLGTGLIALGTACAERELSAERSRHRWAGKGGFAESQGPNSRHSYAESPLSSRHRAIHS
jgi:hypothetical protein